MSTRFPSGQEIARKWYVVDATGQTLGRLASRVARILTGKESSMYTPFIDAGDHVIGINAQKIKGTGRKSEQQVCRHFPGFPGGLRAAAFRPPFEPHPPPLVHAA